MPKTKPKPINEAAEAKGAALLRELEHTERVAQLRDIAYLQCAMAHNRSMEATSSLEAAAHSSACAEFMEMYMSLGEDSGACDCEICNP